MSYFLIGTMAREEVKQWINDNWNFVDCVFLDLERF